MPKIIELDDEEYEALIASKENKGKPEHDLGSPLFEQILQGATLGFSDEMQAGAQSAFDKGAGLLGFKENKPISEFYDTNLSALQKRNKNYEEDNPISSFGLNFGGSLLTGGWIANKISKLQKLKDLPSFARYGFAAVPVGAASGAGYSDPGLANRTMGAASGGAIGLGTGMAIPAAAGVAKGMTHGIKNSLSSKAGKTFAQRKYLEALERDGINFSKLPSRLKTLGPEATLTDAGGDSVERLARGATAFPGKASSKASTSFWQRQLNRNKRVTDVIKKTLGNGDDFYNSLEAIQKERSELAKPLYKKAYDSRITVDDELVAILKAPSAQKAFERAKRIAGDEGVDLPQVFEIVDGKAIGIKTSPDVRTLDYIKRGLDDVISDHIDDFGKIKGEVGYSVQRLKNRLLEKVDDMAPAYKEARQVSAGQFANENALKLGRSILNKDSEMTAKYLARMSDSEKEFFRIGAARALRDEILRAPDGADAYKRLFGNDLIREKLRAVFPDGKSYNQFKKQMLIENRFHNTRTKVLGNSATARIEADKADIGVDPNAVMDFARGNWMDAAINQAKTILTKASAPSEKISNELAEVLFTTDQEKNQQIIKELMKVAPRFSQKQREILGSAIITGLTSQEMRLLNAATTP